MRNLLILVGIVVFLASCNKSDFKTHHPDVEKVTSIEYQYALRGMTCDTGCVILGVPDADCDGVIDSLDVCNGGVDTIDNNMDGLPDCAFPPDFDDIIDDWKCGNKLGKILICHVPPGNPAAAHTICVSPNAIPAHMHHDDDNGAQNDGYSDYLGPCKEVCMDSTSVPPTTGPIDADCDGVTDSLDLCPGGNDMIDNNNDGLPDCAFPPDFDDIIGDWKCGQGDSTKIIICHVPPGNPGNAHDICVSPNAIPAHMSHDDDNGTKDDGLSDYLGPCNAIVCP